MQGFPEFCDHLSRFASDDEVVETLKEHFSAYGAVSSASRFPALDKSDRRYFLIQFKNSADAIKVTSQCELRSFAFNGVLVELGLLPKDSN